MKSRFLLALLICCFSLNSLSLPNNNLPGTALEAEGKGEWEKAISIYLDLLLKEPNRAELWVRIANIQHHLKNDEAAILSYQHAAQIKPNDAALYKALSELYAAQKQPEQALANIIEAVKFSPNNKQYILAKIQLANWSKNLKMSLEGTKQLFALTQSSNSKRENIRLLSIIADAQAKLQQYLEAITTTKQLIALDPNAWHYQDLAITYLMIKDNQNALLAIDKAIRMQPKVRPFYFTKLRIAIQAKNAPLISQTQQMLLSFSTTPRAKAETLSELANLLIKQNQPNEALGAYNQALQLDPNNAKIYKRISEFYAVMNNPNQALAAIEQASRLEPQNKEYLKAKAQLANWAKNNIVAMEAYQKLYELSKTVPINKEEQTQALLGIASLQNQMHQYVEVIKTYEELIRINPNQVSYYKDLSKTYIANKEPQKAQEMLNKALAIEPQNPEILKAIANTANLNKDPKTALQTYLRLLELNKAKPLPGEETKFLLAIASLHNQMHQYPEAIKTYQELIKLNPKQTSYYKFLSETYASNKDPQRALESIEQALILEPQDIQYLKAKASIANWLKNDELAKETYLQILKLNPNDQEIRDLLYKKTNPVATVEAPKSPFQKALDDANQAAANHQYEAAASFMKQAISMKPGDASLYKKLSEIYGTAKQPKQALNAIDKALVIEPTNIEYLRTRGKIAAWLGDAKIMEESYLRILKLKPTDMDAMENYAAAMLWEGKTDEALAMYRKILALYPKNAKIWLQYAEVLSWVGNFTGSLKALHCYSALKGEDFDYLRTKARVFAGAGWYNSALRINEPLLAKDKKNTYLLSTEVTVLNKSWQVEKAVDTLGQLNKLASPNDGQVRGQNNIIRTPLRHNLNLEGFYTWASDTTRIADIPVTGQYFISPSTSLQFFGLYEHAKAAVGSGLDTNDNKPTIYDETAMIGFTHQFPGLFNLNASAGGLKIQDRNNHGVYNTSVNTNLGETAKVTFQSSFNLYRAYLIPQSPRSISNQIMENRRLASLEWQPFIQKYLNVVVSQSDLSDNNSYWHYNIWPKARIWASQYWLVTLGANADLWRYRRRTGDGYYAPLKFNGFEGTAEFYYAYTDNIGLSFWGAFGMQKDETFPRYFYEEDLGAQLFLGIFTDWELKGKAGYTLRYNPTGQYRSWVGGLVLTRRF